MSTNDEPIRIVRSHGVPEGEAFVLGDWLERDENGEPTGEINAAGVAHVTGWAPPSDPKGPEAP